MQTANEGTAWLIWGCLWRAGRYGVLLGAGLGGVYSAAFGTLIFPVVGTLFSFFFGALAGAVVGLPLGLLDGLLISWVAATYRGIRPLNPRRFRLQAEILCVAGPFLALLTDWALHGLPDPDGFASFRAYVVVFELFFISLLSIPTKYVQTGAPLDVISLSIWVFVPMPMILVASWLTGRRVARWYVDEVSET
jgi:hypothetical protein